MAEGMHHQTEQSLHAFLVIRPNWTAQNSSNAICWHIAIGAPTLPVSLLTEVPKIVNSNNSSAAFSVARGKSACS